MEGLDKIDGYDDEEVRERREEIVKLSSELWGELDVLLGGRHRGEVLAHRFCLMGLASLFRFPVVTRVGNTYSLFSSVGGISGHLPHLWRVYDPPQCVFFFFRFCGATKSTRSGPAPSSHPQAAGNIFQFTQDLSLHDGQPVVLTADYEPMMAAAILVG